MLRMPVGVSLLLALVGCSQYLESPPYLEGTFVGFYQTDEQATPVGMRIQTEVAVVQKERYTFTGTATFGDRSYSVEGYEESNQNLNYLNLTAQVLAPSGSLVMNFTDSSGTLVYALCSDVLYDSYTFRNTHLYQEACDPSTSTYEGTFATVDLKRYGD